MRIKLNLEDAGCQKPGCKHKLEILHRHHMRHEKRWINLWSYGPPPHWRRPGEWIPSRHILLRLRERYFQFRSRDVIRLCEWHHIEIHEAYKVIYHQAEIKFKMPWKAFGWKEAIFVMRECKKYCKEWLQRSSPGINPKSSGWRDH